MKIIPSNNNSVETEAVAQALLYDIGCFFLAGLLSVITVQMLGKEMSFPVFFLARFILPLQGFFSTMVYVIPHIISV